MAGGDRRYLALIAPLGDAEAPCRGERDGHPWVPFWMLRPGWKTTCTSSSAVVKLYFRPAEIAGIQTPGTIKAVRVWTISGSLTTYNLPPPGRADRGRTQTGERNPREGIFPTHIRSRTGTLLHLGGTSGTRRRPILVQTKGASRTSREVEARVSPGSPGQPKSLDNFRVDILGFGMSLVSLAWRRAFIESSWMARRVILVGVSAYPGLVKARTLALGESELS